MKKYIKIESFGVIDVNAFVLIGASSKRADKSKIGFFGSGLKYSISFLLRNKIDFKVFADYNEIQFDTEPVLFRDIEFSTIKVNGQLTSMTTDMGIDWLHWFIIRELYCNAIDEGGHQITIVTEQDVKPLEGHTVFYIHVTPEFQSIVDKWDDYISMNRRDVLYESKGDRIFTGGDRKIIYRKGVQCHLTPSSKSAYHYDMSWIEINESRTIKYEWQFNDKIVSYLKKCPDLYVVAGLLNLINETWEKELDWESSPQDFHQVWCDLLSEFTLVPIENGGFWSEIIAKQPEHYKVLPGRLCTGVKFAFPNEIRVIGNVNGGEEVKWRVIDELNKRQESLLKDCIEFLKLSDYLITHEITVVDFINKRRLGMADLKNKKILLSVKLFDMGRKEIVSALIEENEHLITGFEDETREFQNHFIGKYITALEEKTGKYL